MNSPIGILKRSRNSWTLSSSIYPRLFFMLTKSKNKRLRPSVLHFFSLRSFLFVERKGKMSFSQIPEQNSEKEKERKKEKKRDIYIQEYIIVEWRSIFFRLSFFSSLVYKAESTYLLPRSCRKQTFSRNYNTRVPTGEKRTSLSNDHAYYWSMLSRSLWT